MRFICPEIDKTADIKDLCRLSPENSASLEGNLVKLFYVRQNMTDSYYYGREVLKKLLNVYNVDNTPKTISEFSSYIGVPIAHNLSDTFNTKTIAFQVSELLKLKTEMWFTIFTDEGLKFYAPKRASTSKEIMKYTVVERWYQYANQAGFAGDTSGEVFGSYLKGDTINAVILGDDEKNAIVNTYMASCDVIKVAVGYQVDPLSYVNEAGTVYVAVSSKLQDGLYYITMVKESVVAFNYSKGNIINENSVEGSYIFERELVSNKDEVEVSGLDIDNDGGYDIEMYIKNGSGVENSIKRIYNNETDSYDVGVGEQWWTGNSHASWDSTGANNGFIYTRNVGEVTVRIRIRKGANGIFDNFRIVYQDQTYGGYWVTHFDNLEVRKANQTDRITSLTSLKFISANAGGFGIGSWIKVKAINTKTSRIVISYEGIPPGGNEDQVLAKASGDDFDTEWIDPPTGGGGLTQAQVLARGLGA